MPRIAASILCCSALASAGDAVNPPFLLNYLVPVRLMFDGRHVRRVAQSSQPRPVCTPTAGQTLFTRRTMNHFEYVMVLISIIIGLGIAHILLGLGGIVDRLTGRGDRLRLSVAHGVWVAHTFLWLVLFWWWQFRMDALWEEWTIGVYFFLVMYAVVLFLIAVILVPRSWDGVTDLGDFFLRRRAWFYAAWILGVSLDVLDSWLKGGMDYIVLENGPWVMLFWLAGITLSAIGIRVQSLRYHATAGGILLLMDFAASVGSLPRLGF
jgi:hypothetical protein